MTHIAIQAAVDGKNVDWMEKVTEEEYNMTASKKSNALTPMPTLDDVRMVAPALERYAQGTLSDLHLEPAIGIEPMTC